MEQESIQGKVKWFSVEKGTGIVHDHSGQDHRFNIHDVIGPDLPAIGDEVSFRIENDHADSGIQEIRIIAPGRQSSQNEREPGSGEPERSSTGKHDPRVECQGCGSHVIPRLWHYPKLLRYMKTQHLCPICGVVMYESGGRLTWWGKVIIAILILPTIVWFIGLLFLPFL